MNVFKTPLLLLSFFLVLTSCKKHHDHDHVEAAGFKLIRNSTVIAQQNGTVVTGNVTLSLAGTNAPITVVFIDEDGHDITDLDDVSLLVEVASSSVAAVVAGPGEWQFNLNPQATGSTTLVVNLMHGSHKDFESRNVTVTVGS